jgi:N-acetylmuramoyl-L-alanine amidase
MQKIEYIFNHHSASDWGDAAEIDKWHKEKGWKGIGYHYVVLNGYISYQDLKNHQISQYDIGKVEKGRALDSTPWLEADEVGAHVYGYNKNSIGVCAIHRAGKYYPEQLFAMVSLNAVLVMWFEIPVKNILGHNEVELSKPSCPGLNMDDFRSNVQDTIEIYKNDPDTYRFLTKKYILE